MHHSLCAAAVCGSVATASGVSGRICARWLLLAVCPADSVEVVCMSRAVSAKLGAAFMAVRA